MLTVLYILLVLFLVLANGFFVAAEFALVGVRRSRVETLAAANDGRARRLLGLRRDGYCGRAIGSKTPRVCSASNELKSVALLAYDSVRLLRISPLINEYSPERTL